MKELLTAFLTTFAGLSGESPKEGFSLTRISWQVSTDTPTICGERNTEGTVSLSRDLMRRVGCGGKVQITLNDGRVLTLIANDVAECSLLRAAKISVFDKSKASTPPVEKGKLTILKYGKTYRYVCP